MVWQGLDITYGAASVRHNIVGYVAAIIRYIFVDIVQGQSGGYGAPSMHGAVAVCIILQLHMVQGQPISLLQLEPFVAINADK